MLRLRPLCLSAHAVLVFSALTWVSRPAAAQDGSRYRQAIAMTLESTAVGGAAELVVTFSRTPTYTARFERSGGRLIIDVPDTDVARGLPVITDPVGAFGGVMAQAFRSGGRPTTRLLITLVAPAEHSILVSKNSLVVRLVPTRPKSKGVSAARGQVSPVSSAEGSQGAASGPEAGELRAIEDIRFESAPLEDRVTVALSASRPRFLARPPSEKSRSVLELEGARLPPTLERTLDVSAFRGRVQRISTYADPSRPGTVILEAEHKEGVVSTVREEGPGLAWLFREPAKLTSSQTGVAADGGVARRSRTVHIETGIAEIPEVHAGFVADDGRALAEATTLGEAVSAFASPVLGQAGGFSGRRIDLDLKDADIHNVLRLLADVGRVNVITADNVSGNITIKMRNIPWDQALDVVLQAKSLGMVRRGNMIRVAPLSELEKEREMAIARKQQEIKLAPLETRLIPVSYATAESLKQRSQPMLSDRGSIVVDDRTNVMIVRDIVGNLNQIEELVRSLDTQTPQVLVEARIVEATSRYLRDVGIQWGGDTTFSGVTGNPTGLAFPNSVGIAGGASDGDTPTAGLSPFSNSVQNPNFAVNLPAAAGTGQGGALGLSFGSIDNNLNLNLRLSAAEATGMLRVLSSPRVLTLDNFEAKIAQGTLIPFSQVSASGVQTTFQEAKLQLSVKPHVTADGSVSMHVRINRDEPDFNQTSARGDPTILKREAETELLVMDGHTAVIGGIFTRNTGRNLDQVPFFGDIPLLGLLFQRRRASDQRGELVIFLTPRIVNRAEALGR